MASDVVAGKSVETSGRTVDEAVDKALERLRRGRAEVKIAVLREASRGVLGFGAHDAIVRVTELIEAPAPVEPSEPAVQEEPPLQAEAPTERRWRQDERVDEPDDEWDDEPDDEPADDLDDQDEAWAAEEPPVEEYVPEPRRRRPQPAALDVADREQVIEVGREVLLELLGQMSVLADVLATWSEPADDEEEATLVLDIVGDDPGLLIGRRGETLRDLQYIVRLIVGRRIEGWANIVVDVEGYKQRRARAVRDNARRLAERVIETSRPVHMEPMNPYERRLVHIELRELDGVTTRRSGEGTHRRVGIFPS